MIKVTKKPEFKKTIAFLDKLDKFDAKSILVQYGRLGVQALAAATPALTGETAGKWSYKIKGSRERYKLIWTNSEMAGTAPLVLLIQYGHGTRGGTFVSGKDFINPALRPIYDALSDRLLEEALR
jgi:hypothetical protein